MLHVLVGTALGAHRLVTLVWRGGACTVLLRGLVETLEDQVCEFALHEKLVNVS